MKITPNNLNKVLYADPEYISSLYEEIEGAMPVTQITNALGFAGNISAGIAGVGTTIHETKTYKVSSRQMMTQLADELEQIADFDEQQYDPLTGTNVSWLSGKLTVGEWKSSTTGQVNQVFELATDGKSHTLVVQKNLFVAGIGLLIDMDSIVSMGINIPVLMLGRILFYNGLVKNFTTSPYLIFEQ